MKKPEFRKLIREEIRKVVNEVDYPQAVSNAHMKPFKGKIAQMAKQLTDLNNEIEQTGPLSEEIQDAIDSLMELVKNL